MIGTKPIKKISGINKVSQWSWQCRCNCGKEFYAAGCRIKSGRVKSCGCKRDEAKLKTKHINPQDLVWKRILRTYKAGALKRNLTFDLDDIFFKNICLQNCYYCGLPPQNVRHLNLKNKERAKAGTI